MLKGKLTSEVVNERHQYINALKHFVEEEKEKLNQVLQQLGITHQSLMKAEGKQVCPYNEDHYVPEKSFKKHIEKCRLLKAGYQTNELPSQFANTDFCYEGKKSLKVEMDESLLNKILWDDCVKSGEVYTGHRSVPVSHVDENINLTQNDRLAVYRYVVEKSHEEGKVITVDKTDELLTTDWGSLVKKGLLDAQNNEMYSSKLEQLAALRDTKRRRQSYRAKNVHITKKSYTEIIREVIVNQMEVLVPARSRRKGKGLSDGVTSSSRRQDEGTASTSSSNRYECQGVSGGTSSSNRYEGQGVSDTYSSNRYEGQGVSSTSSSNRHEDQGVSDKSSTKPDDRTRREEAKDDNKRFSRRKRSRSGSRSRDKRRRHDRKNDITKNDIKIEAPNLVEHVIDNESHLDNAVKEDQQSEMLEQHSTKVASRKRSRSTSRSSHSSCDESRKERSQHKKSKHKKKSSKHSKKHKKHKH